MNELMKFCCECERKEVPQVQKENFEMIITVH